MKLRPACPPLLWRRLFRVFPAWFVCSFAAAMCWSAPTSQAPQSGAGSPPTAAEVRAAMEKATRFMLSISTEGGYLYKYSPDLKRRAGEQFATDTQIWVQPPGTPSVGEAFLNAYAATGDRLYLDAARKAALALARCQLPSGGWHYSGDFDPKYPLKDGVFSYQGAHSESEKARKNPLYYYATTFDDKNTQYTVRFLMRFIEAATAASASGIEDSSADADARIAASLDRALACMLASQYPNGAWPQRYKGEPRKASDHPAIAASFPEQYARTWPGDDYTAYYTFNDSCQLACMDVMLEAWRRYKKPGYLESAKRGADFILLAQMPAPQRGWAQQYDFKMHPAWARIFEPPAVCSNETRTAIEALLDVYLETGEEKYFHAIQPAVDWLKRSAYPNGLWSRRYELKTNKPIQGGHDGRIHDTDAADPDHSTFKIPEFFALYERVKKTGRDAFLAAREKESGAKRGESPKVLAANARAVIAKLDEKGRWLTREPFRKKAGVAELISTKVYINNMATLEKYLRRIEADKTGKADKAPHKAQDAPRVRP